MIKKITEFLNQIKKMLVTTLLKRQYVTQNK